MSMNVCPKLGECVGCKAEERSANPLHHEHSMRSWLDWYVQAFSATVLASRHVCKEHEVEVAAALLRVRK